ncbi:MAG: 6-phosphogluconolactonase [Armatimonadetes bacterium]|nr:6-phosphogluconolactonase [Armatimonadota bacterium]
MNASDRGDIVICPDVATLAREVARRFAEHARRAVAARGRFMVALSGGSTPRGLYAVLAGDPYREDILWARTHVFWGDERCVPPDHPESNYGMAREVLLSRVPVPPENVYRMVGEHADPEAAAARYEAVLREVFHLDAGNVPVFDLILLGLGDDGHTASLFPGSAALREQRRLVAAPFVDRLNVYRLTLTPPVFNHAAAVMFLVAGWSKAAGLRAVLEGPDRPERLPAQIVRPERATLLWLVDQAAASLLTRRA